MARILYFGKLSSIYGELSETADLPASVADTAALRRANLATAKLFAAGGLFLEGRF